MSTAHPPSELPQQDRTLRDLDWPALVRAVGRGCMSEQGVERVEALEPAATLEQARERMQLTAEALDALAEGEPVPAASVPGLDEILDRVRRGGLASAGELRDVGQVLEVAAHLRPYARARQPSQPLLAQTLGTDPSLDRLADQLARAIDAEGRIADGASDELGAARRRARGARARLLERLGQLVARFGDVLREPRHVECEGRYGLPVRSDAHRRVDGIVLGSSASGATIYVEPREITELSNRLKMAESDVERELVRVLAALTAELHQQADGVEQAYQACIEADVLAALCRWAQEHRAVAVVPDDEPRIDLVGMRHPLLVVGQGAVVPNDIALRSGCALVISGPNAGGKTVALKGLGLAACMAYAGIPLPVEERSRLGWFAEVLTNVGDEQSVEHSLSTFSAHAANLGRIVERSGPRSLVLLDEVAGGTDPEEGAALAGAVLETLVECGAAVAVTTHYERLKELASQMPELDNASVGFDFDAMQPTFRLTLGVPGASSALAVAARCGISAAVIERAHALLPERTVEREQLLAELERERSTVVQAREQAEQEAERAASLRADLESERQVVRQKERERLARQAAGLHQAIREARAKLRALSAMEPEQGSAAQQRRAQRLVDEVARHVAVGSPIDRALRDRRAGSAERAPAPGELRPGLRVFVERLGATAEVSEPPERGMVRVRAGAFSMRVPVAELRLDPKERRATSKNAAARQAARPAPPPSSTPSLQSPLRTSGNTCDLRGLRVDEALAELDLFVDRCLSAAESVGFVLHGHGTGALKQAVREHLAGSQLVVDYRPAELGEGGDAFTIFWLDV